MILETATQYLLAKQRIGILTDSNGYYLKIEPEKGWVPLNLRELWEYRELLYFLTWRDIKVRYKQTVLGVAWAVLQPVLTMIVFSVFFNKLAGITLDGDEPYAVSLYTAIVPWTFFATGLSMSANSLVTGANLLKKVYFPRLVMPLGTVLAGGVDFLIAFAVLILMMIGYGIAPTLNIIFLPLFILLALVTSLGVGLWLSAMNVQFRDVRYTIPFLVQIWFFITPIAYSSGEIENELYRILYGVNPMVGVVEGFRWALLGSDSAPAPDGMIFVSAVVALVILVSGLFYFKRMEKTFADVV